jgi:hypothetical protein
MVCTKDVEQEVSYPVKVFTLQELAITLRGNADKMPVYFNMQFNYTIRQLKTFK